jgi:hypothetical protein
VGVHVFGSHFSVAILVRLPQIICGTVRSVNIAIIIPKIPNGSIGPLLSTQLATKKVQAKLTMDRIRTTITKQSLATELYDSMS